MLKNKCKLNQIEQWKPTKVSQVSQCPWNGSTHFTLWFHSFALIWYTLTLSSCVCFLFSRAYTLYVCHVAYCLKSLVILQIIMLQIIFWLERSPLVLGLEVRRRAVPLDGCFSKDHLKSALSLAGICKHSRRHLCFSLQCIYLLLYERYDFASSWTKSGDVQCFCPFLWNLFSCLVR